MPALVVSEPKPEKQPKRSTALGEILREVLEGEQSAVVDAMRVELMDRMEKLAKDIKAGGERTKVAADAVREAVDEAAKIHKPATLEAAVARLEKAVTAAMDERMGEVVTALMHLRTEVKAGLVRAATPVHNTGQWVGVPERSGGDRGPITKITFSHVEKKGAR